jgi:hypothetical protein
VSKIQRGGYSFVTYIGDHPPRHVHVYKDGRLVVKWDLEASCAMKGSAGKRVRKLIEELEGEGQL